MPIYYRLADVDKHGKNTYNGAKYVINILERE